MEILNKLYNKKVILGITLSILLVAMCTVPGWAKLPGTQSKIADYTEGGHLETDFGAGFMAEWWYLNGDVRLVASDGEKRDGALHVVMAHQESPSMIGSSGAQLSHMLTFYGLHFDDGAANIGLNEMYINNTNVSDYIALNTTYVDYTYPDGVKRLYGSAVPGYNLEYTFDNVTMDLFFQTNVDKTIDESSQPLNFTTYEYSYGTLHGSIIIDGKKYTVTKGEGYFDHMIPVSDIPWPMDMHGWSWFEVTTKDYQAVAYATRSLIDGYDNYSYKHLTLLNKHNGKVLEQYSADEITITEEDWKDENEFNRKRPNMVTFSTPNLNVTVNASSVVDLNMSRPDKIGFIDFMAFQPENAIIQYNGDVEMGSAFYEYLVSDWGVMHP
ncbi:MAG TPA: hypothetical protein C5S51_09955 [Methanosarcinaceae archaeon]|nr:hypothetical protein [Methanosarcinaceae archaeon]